MSASRPSACRAPSSPRRTGVSSSTTRHKKARGVCLVGDAHGRAGTRAGIYPIRFVPQPPRAPRRLRPRRDAAVLGPQTPSGRQGLRPELLPEPVPERSPPPERPRRRLGARVRRGRAGRARVRARPVGRWRGRDRVDDGEPQALGAALPDRRLPERARERRGVPLPALRGGPGVRRRDRREGRRRVAGERAPVRDGEERDVLRVLGRRRRGAARRGGRGEARRRTWTPSKHTSRTRCWSC
jgi:hypothetical protein